MTTETITPARLAALTASAEKAFDAWLANGFDLNGLDLPGDLPSEEDFQAVKEDTGEAIDGYGSPERKAYADAFRKAWEDCYLTGASHEAFEPTHVVAYQGTKYVVMLCEGQIGNDGGPAYIRGEWDASDSADFVCSDAGEWTFQGRPAALVRAILG